MRRKKMIVAIALVIVMLLNCIAPVLKAQAETSKTAMSFNSDLYYALKSYFQEKGIRANYNDGLHAIKMEESVIASIEELSLKEKGISDLTGLDAFHNVKSLILSANDLDENSNLAVLNNFASLTYLDISSNQISDISSIEGLVERLVALDSNAINLSSQNVKCVVDVSINSNEQKTEVEYSLPQILQLSGIVENGTIKNKGVLKSEWVNTKYYTNSNASFSAPYIINSSIPNPISSTNNTFKIQVGSDDNGGYSEYQGLIKWVINIKDTGTSSYNVNPASQNILKDSIFTLYYVVHSEDSEGIVFKDSNFYRAVKEQLTEGQTINNELSSYKYATDEDGNQYYDECDVSLSGTTATLKINDTIVYTITNFNPSGYNSNSTIYDADGNYYEIQYYEVENIDTYNEEGVFVRKLKVKVPHYNEDSRDLYVDSYDEAYTLVISDLDLLNKITSLILNDQRITDLSGLEKFVGLESKLNVSYNYIETLASIYALQYNKENAKNSVQENFNSAKALMASTKDVVTTSYANAENVIKSIEEKIKEIKKAISDAEELDSEDENYEEKIKPYKDIVKADNEAIWGDGTDENNGLIGDLAKALNDSSTGINSNIYKLYDRLSRMYQAFNKEYKLTSLLIPDINYQTDEEYDAFKGKINTLNGAKELVSAEVTRISTLENANALSELEKELIINALGLTISPDEQNPISKALQERINNLTEANASRIAWVNIINSMIEVDVYSQAANYCLLERMNNSTATDECYVEKYLSKRIKELDDEGINCDVVKAIYDRVLGNLTSSIYSEELYNIFERYQSETRECTYENPYFCKGNYDRVYEVYFDKSISTSILGNYIEEIYLIEELYHAGINFDDTYFYNQLINLANKFTAIDETSRYVALPELKILDIRNNEIETFGDTLVTMVSSNGTETTSTQNLATLKNLKELYAGHNIVTGDIACVDWSAMKGLKKLDLSYNYITDISPLQSLENIRYLDVSDNLLEGSFNLRLREMPKLKDIILAGNKYNDLSQILLDYEMEAEGDFTRYFAREDTVNIDLSRQELEIEIEDAIPFDSTRNVYPVELPPIFAQLEYIDAQRTAYGTTSSKGTITAKGGVAYVPVSRIGEFVGIVKVIAANGYPEDVETSMGINSTCTIKYVVDNIKVNSVMINEDITEMEKGTSKTFTATVDVEKVSDKTVEWSVSGNNSEDTKITQDGVLTVAKDETANQITITATSNYDDSVKMSKTINLYAKEVTNITVSGDTEITAGKSATYTAEVIGNILEDDDKKVTWSVEGNNSRNTQITEEGILTVANNEDSDKITVIATSVFDNEKTGSLEVSINKKTVKEITITGEQNIRTGNSEVYTAEVTGDYLDDEDKTVSWKIVSPLYQRYYSENTKLEVIEAKEDKEVENVGGAIFTISPDEQVEEFVIEATSNFDGNVYARFTVSINKKAVREVKITKSTESIITGKTGSFEAEVTGEYLDDKDKTITWSIEGNNSQNTTIAEDGVLTIGEDETAEKVKVIATSDFDNEKFAQYEVTVNRKEITNIRVYEQGVSIELDEKGKTYLFTEIVEGNFLDTEDKGVTWSVEGNTSTITRITQTGILIVGEDETATSLTVKATSKFDTTKSGTSIVAITKKPVASVTTVKVNEQNKTIEKGKSFQFTVTVEGENLKDSDKTVTWSVTGNNSINTKITADGKLTIGEDETATSLTVKATSKLDVQKNGTSTVTVKEVVVLPTLGYTVDSEDDIVGVSPDTTSQTFKTKLLNDSSYSVVVKRNGTEITNTAKVATGDIVIISKGSKVVATYEIVVKGDVNGDGTVDISDTVLVKGHRAKLNTLTGVYFKAGDVDNDGEITISDVRLILAHRAKMDGYIL